MSKFLRISSIVAALVVFACGVSFAQPVSQLSSVITSSSGGYSDNLLATVTYAGGVYHYEYTLSYISSYASSPLTWLSVGNLNNLEFTNAGNDQNLANPVYGVTSTNSIIWTGSAPVGQTIKLWYDSIYQPTAVSVSLKGSRLASGSTLGMTTPEPGALASLAVGLSGIFGLALKKRSANS